MERHSSRLLCLCVGQGGKCTCSNSVTVPKEGCFGTNRQTYSTLKGQDLCAPAHHNKPHPPTSDTPSPPLPTYGGGLSNHTVLGPLSGSPRSEKWRSAQATMPSILRHLCRVLKSGYMPKPLTQLLVTMPTSALQSRTCRSMSMQWSTCLRSVPSVSVKGSGRFSGRM